MTKIDKWFLSKLYNIVECGRELDALAPVMAPALAGVGDVYNCAAAPGSKSLAMRDYDCDADCLRARPTRQRHRLPQLLTRSR